LRIGNRIFLAALTLAVTLQGQQGRGRGAAPAPGQIVISNPRTAYPERAPADPAVVERGKALYSVNCSFCHGSEARGGESGPNLIRAQLVMNDQNGELIAPVVQNGRPALGMPKFDMTASQVSDIAAFIHSFKVAGYDISRKLPPSILVGDAKAGEAYFKAACASCHSVDGDLKGFAARFPDPKAMQQWWMMPGGGRGGPATGSLKPVTVTVTPSSGPKVEGRLVRIDDFIVTLTDADNNTRTIRRVGDSPKVELHDPIKPHRDLLRTYVDKDIHNLTAYLVTVK